MALGRIGMSAALLATLAHAQEPDPHAHHRHAAPATAEGGWVTYQHKTAGYTLEHPADWRVVNDQAAVSIHIAHPTRAAHMFASVFTMSDGTLQDFAALKFGVQPELFTPLGPARSMDGDGWSGLVQDAQATEGAERARRRILCAKHGTRYVSLALYVDPKELSESEAVYDRIFKSLRFGELAPPGSPPAPPR